MSRFLTLWTLEMLSSIGSGLTVFALTAYVFTNTGRAGSSSTILLVSFLPSFLIRPFAGVLADRFNRLNIMIFGNAASAAVMALLLIPSGGTLGTDITSYSALAGISLLGGVMNPAYKASVSDLVPPSLYSRAAGMNQMVSGAPLLLSPFAAGFMMAHWSIKTILITDIISFLIAASGISVLAQAGVSTPARSPERKPISRELSEGLNEIRKKDGIGTLVILISGILFFTGLIQALLGPMVLSFTSVEQLGVIQSLCATGILLGAVLSGWIGGHLSLRCQLTGALVLAGLAYSLMGLQETAVMVLVPGFFFFLALPSINTAAEVLIRNNTESSAQGRVWAFVGFLTFTGTLLAFGSAGFLSDRVFIPLLMPGGSLAPSLGKIFGTGPGRGIAALFSLSGAGVCLLALRVYRSSSIKKLELTESFGQEGVLYDL